MSLRKPKNRLAKIKAKDLAKIKKDSYEAGYNDGLNSRREYFFKEIESAKRFAYYPNGLAPAEIQFQQYMARGVITEDVVRNFSLEYAERHLAHNLMNRIISEKLYRQETIEVSGMRCMELQMYIGKPDPSKHLPSRYKLIMPTEPDAKGYVTW
jgi:hypothetical protein